MSWQDSRRSAASQSFEFSTPTFQCSIARRLKSKNSPTDVANAGEFCTTSSARDDGATVAKSRVNGQEFLQPRLAAKVSVLFGAQSVG
jgi:hypothetical protein